MSESVTPPWEFENPVCAEVGTEIFFSKDYDEVNGTTLPQDTYKDAKKLCQSCEHVAECAEWGIRYENFGVWGGLSPADRKNLRARRTRRGRPLKENGVPISFRVK